MKKKSVLLIGLGRFGSHIAQKLNEYGHDIMAIDKDEVRVNKVMSIVTDAQIGDSTSKDFLSSLGVDKFDVCIVAIGGDFQSSLETSFILKELGAKKVVSRAECDAQEKFLLRNGADEVVYPEKQLANWIAVKYCSDHVLDYIEIDSNVVILEVSTPKEWVDKTLAQIDIRKKYNISVIAVKENGKVNAPVLPDKILSSDSSLLVLGEEVSLKKCFNI